MSHYNRINTVDKCLWVQGECCLSNNRTIHVPAFIAHVAGGCGCNNKWLGPFHWWCVLFWLALSHGVSLEIGVGPNGARHPLGKNIRSQLTSYWYTCTLYMYCLLDDFIVLVLHVHVHVCTYMYMYMYVYTCTYMYVHVCTCIYTNI